MNSATRIYDAADEAAIAEVCASHAISTEEFAALRAKAAAAKATAYAPYSQFRVGAALLAVDEAGERAWISGANVENTSYPSVISHIGSEVVSVLTRLAGWGPAPRGWRWGPRSRAW